MLISEYPSAKVNLTVIQRGILASSVNITDSLINHVHSKRHVKLQMYNSLLPERQVWQNKIH